MKVLLEYYFDEHNGYLNHGYVGVFENEDKVKEHIKTRSYLPGYHTDEMLLELYNSENWGYVNFLYALDVDINTAFNDTGIQINDLIIFKK
jgi:hypothetical protein